MKQPNNKASERSFEIGVLVVAGIIIFWLVTSEVVALIAGGHHFLPTLSPSLKALYDTVAKGNPVIGWSKADRMDLPSPMVFWLTTVMEIVVVGASIWIVSKKGWLDSQHDPKRRAPTRADIKENLSVTALKTRTSHLRNDINVWERSVKPEHIGLFLGTETTTHQEVWAAQDDSILMIGPPGSGKTSGFIVPAISEAPGAVIATSTRDEIVRHTAAQRCANGHDGWVFAPQLDMPDIPGVRALAWNPLDGCDDHLTAIARATSLVKGGAGFNSSTTNADFWEASGIAVMRCYLMAGCVGEKTMADVVQWSTAPTSQVPRNILRSYAPGWGAELEQLGNSSPQLVGSVWSGVRRALDCFADPRVLDACSGATNFRIGDFLANHGTAYFVGSGGTQLSIAPIVSALIEAITEQARQSQGRGHLTTPLSCILDEAANIAPLPTLPSLLSDGGGSGIQLLVVLQSLAQGRHRWSEAEMDAMWDASTIKIVLPGMSHAQDLSAISQLTGEIEELRTSTTTGEAGASKGESTAKVPAWTPEQIRGLPVGHALVLHRRLKPIEIISTPYWERKQYHLVTGS